MYLWNKPEWPAFTWNKHSLTRLLAQVSREQGRLLGRMESLGFELRNEAHLCTLTTDVIKSSEIEGEILDLDPLLIAGLAHLWFITIHPFNDGNGRIARAIADTKLPAKRNRRCPGNTGSHTRQGPLLGAIRQNNAE